MRTLLITLAMAGLAAAATGKNFNALSGLKALGGLSLPSLQQEPKLQTVPELIEYWGYEVEEHQVTTDDGYILTMQRIPNPGGTPVFLAHCLYCTAAIFAAGPPEQDIVYLLADAGYDVWLGNTRGNTWSKDHETLDPEEPEFWDFEWGTTAVSDYPAELDYILEETGFDDLFFIGYSMGGTQYFAFLSDMPEYNEKIKAAFMLAPAVFMGNAFNPVLLLSPVAELLEGLLHENWDIYEFLWHRDIFSILGHNFCDDDHPETQAICVDILGAVIGPEVVNASMIPIYLDHFPGGHSVTTLSHYAQLHLNPDTFTKFDFGREGNQEAYGQDTPPEYDLSKVTVPTAIFAGDRDGFAAVADLEILRDSIPNLLHYEVVDWEGWSHFNFAFADNRGELVYSKILNMINDMN